MDMVINGGSVHFMCAGKLLSHIVREEEAGSSLLFFQLCKWSLFSPAGMIMSCWDNHSICFSDIFWQQPFTINFVKTVTLHFCLNLSPTVISAPRGNPPAAAIQSSFPGAFQFCFNSSINPDASNCSKIT